MATWKALLCIILGATVFAVVLAWILISTEDAACMEVCTFTGSSMRMRNPYGCLCENGVLHQRAAAPYTMER